MAVSIEHRGSQLGKIDQVEPGDFGQHNLSPFCQKCTGAGSGDVPAPLDDQDQASVKAAQAIHSRMTITGPHLVLAYARRRHLFNRLPDESKSSVRYCAPNQELRPAFGSGDSTGTTARVLRNDPRLNCGARLKRQALSLLMTALIRLRVDLACASG